MAERSKLPNYSWIQFKINYLDDADFAQLTSAAVGVYVKLYLMAGRADAAGLLCNQHRTYQTRDLSFLLRIEEKELEPVLTELDAVKFLERDGDGWRVVRFLDEQGPGNEENRSKWRERQERHRNEAKQNKANSSIEEIKEETSTHKNRLECHRDVTVTNPEGVCVGNSFSLEGENHGDILELAFQQYPEELRTVLDGFCMATQLTPPLPGTEGRHGFTEWVEALRRIAAQCSEFDDDSIMDIFQRAYYSLSDEASGKVV